MRRTLTILSLLLTALLLAVVVRCLFVTQYRVTDTDGDALRAGDRVLVNRMAYGWRVPGERWWGYSRVGSGQPVRGEYVAFYDPSLYGPADRRPVRVGRVVAVPGDTLWFDVRRCTLLPGRTTTDARPIPVPGAGSRVGVTAWNARLLWNTLRRHESLHVVLVSDSALRFDGHRLDSVGFRQDYYWLSGSLGYGLVPASALVGRAFCVSYSLNDSLHVGRRFRTDRFFLPL